MGLADSLQNFDAKKDKVSTDFAGLPEGDYEVILDGVNHRSFKSGYECLGFKFTVISGKHMSESEFINVSLALTSMKGNSIPEFIVTRNVKTIAKVGSMVGLDITPADFPDDSDETDLYEHFQDIFHKFLGNPLKIKKWYSPNKKDPDNPYSNYDFAESSTQIEVPEVDNDSVLPENKTINDIDVDDVGPDDLPF